MSINNFIPAVWTAEILKNLNNDHVFAKCCNRDYEGEITGFGSSVKINSIGRITISSYTRDTDIADPETVDDAGQNLLIDQSKYYNFAVDDVDAAQAKGDVMGAAMGEASWGLAETVDDFLATTMNAAVATANTLIDCEVVILGLVDEQVLARIVDRFRVGDIRVARVATDRDAADRVDLDRRTEARDLALVVAIAALREDVIVVQVLQDLGGPYRRDEVVDGHSAPS
jgi:hypothetical protein